MPFETPNIDLVGKISATIHEHDGVDPTTIIKAGTPWSVHVDWSLLGKNWEMVAGFWHVHVNLESIGPGPERSLFDLDVDCRNQELPSADGTYSCHFDVPGSVITPAMVPHQSLPMKLVVTLTYRNRLGQPGPMAAYYEGPIVQFYDPS